MNVIDKELSRAFKSRNLRMTKQRAAILEVLRGTDLHPTADWIYEKVREILPNISLGTVYRNLNILKEHRLLKELNDGGEVSHFDGNTENHYHFICLRCKRIFDIDEPVDIQLDRRISSKTGFEIDHHRLEFYGICPACRGLPY